MTSRARQKVDPNIRDMFDPEVERPDHDKLLTTLFNDQASLHALLMAAHDVKPLKPFDESSRFRLFPWAPSHGKKFWLSYAEATEKTGVAPVWTATSGVRITSTRLEVPLEYSNSDGRYGRVIGFIDIAVGYQLIGWPSVQEQESSFEWARNEPDHCAMIEVKAAWPTVGNLVRQLQLYRYSSPLSYGNRKRLNIVVGPDDSMNDVLCAHGYRLATFDSAGTAFRLVPGTVATAAPEERKHGEF